MTFLSLLLRTCCRFRTSLWSRPLLRRRLWYCTSFGCVWRRTTFANIRCVPTLIYIWSRPPLDRVRCRAIRVAVARVGVPHLATFRRTRHVAWSRHLGFNGLPLIVIHFGLAIEHRRSAILRSRRLIVIRSRTWNRPSHRVRYTVVAGVLLRRIRCWRAFRIHRWTTLTRRSWYVPLCGT